MARWRKWLGCLGRAVWKITPKAAFGVAMGPLVGYLYEIAVELRNQLAGEQSDVESRLALAELVTVAPAEVAAEAQAVAQKIAADEPVAVQQSLARYLELAPEVSRHSLRRAEDPKGVTVPPLLLLDQPRSLMPFIPPAPPRFQPGDRPPGLNGWVLVRRLGAGGFGEVWQAHHPKMEAEVAAVKFCMDESARRLLEHEAKVIRQVMKLGHSVPGIVPLLDFNVQADLPWLKYQFVPGGDLLAHAAPFFGAAATSVIQELAHTVGQFHRLAPPVVHRDLKPGNILLSRGPTGHALLQITDFGIGGTASTWALDQERRNTLPTAALPTALVGSHTPLYASPQQRQGARADPRDDVFALGVLWYQLLIGNLTSERPAGNWRRRLAPLSLPELLLDLLGDCCSDDPEERPRDAAALEEAIARCQPGTSITPPRPKELTNSMGMRFVLVPAGTFWMGGGGGEASAQQVSVPHDLYISVFPVTQGQWQFLMGDNPSHFSRGGGGKDLVRDISDADLSEHPVEEVSWEDAQRLIERLNARESESGWAYRLPTEAEWEYACRGGATSKADCTYHFYLRYPSNIMSSTQANFDGHYPDGAAQGPSLERTSKVGLYPPNRLGIYDMHGNVWEWSDTLEGSMRVIRGGSWHNYGSNCRAAYRYWDSPWGRSSNLGLRLVRAPSGPT
jgi:formylglycine-generating enzyme required for sulfatase activity